MSEEDYTMEKLQSVLAEMESIEADISTMMEQERLTSMVLDDFKAAEDTLRELAEGGDEREVLMPLGGGVMVKARINPEESILVGIGSGISLEKKASDGLEEVEKRREEMDNGLEGIRNRIKDMDGRRREMAVYAQRAYSYLQSQEADGGAH